MGDKNASLFLNEQRSDVRVLVSTHVEVWSFPAHSLILCNASETLARIIENVTANDDGRKEIIIQDLTSATVLNLLRYIYVGKLTMNKWEDLLDLLYAASKYQLCQLIRDCEDRLISQINTNNVCDIIERAHNLQLTSIEAKCVEIIKVQAVIVLSTTSFLNLSRDILTMLLSSDDLNVPDEMTVFRALWRWGKKECSRMGRPLDEEQIEEMLDSLLECIRIHHIKEVACLPPCLRKRHKPQPASVTNLKASIKGKQDKKQEEVQELFKKERVFQPIDMISYSSNVCLMGPRCWEGIREMTEKTVFCALFSTNHSVYVTGFCIDVIEKNPSGNSLFICINDEMAGSDIIRQECRWVDSYDRKGQTTTELWHLSETCIGLPILLKPNNLYSFSLHTVGTKGDTFPYQTVKQRNIDAGNGINFTIHGSELIALRNLCFIPIDENDIWS